MQCILAPLCLRKLMLCRHAFAGCWIEERALHVQARPLWRLASISHAGLPAPMLHCTVTTITAVEVRRQARMWLLHCSNDRHIQPLAGSSAFTSGVYRWVPLVQRTSAL